ncbi:Uncharacterized [Moorella glycerini]|uniref:Uncharacterized protein n=1 Tax=Neomoorella stamsii TaxID=1266720 RepID=A0A9X7J335_9FIRM|nr:MULTISPECIES: hypothetical protein [Moorella]PRR72745.1 hypothetical protein MOST_16390 [Moorella stamsii]CEP68090.1 Uncharacterized [Moorella glycerini]
MNTTTCAVMKAWDGLHRQLFLLEKKTPTLPDYIEKIYIRQEEKRLVLKFKNRRNQPARLELTLPEAA